LRQCVLPTSPDMRASSPRNRAYETYGPACCYIGRDREPSGFAHCRVGGSMQQIRYSRVAHCRQRLQRAIVQGASFRCSVNVRRQLSSYAHACSSQHGLIGRPLTLVSLRNKLVDMFPHEPTQMSLKGSECSLSRTITGTGR
jgi:hypothetical protein